MESAVLLKVPEAEPLAGPLRSAADPSAARGVPAHVTLLAPFLPGAAVDAGVLGELEWFFAGVDGFLLRFNRVGRFEDRGVVYLAPDEPKVLAELTAALVRRWPECSPYAGAHDEGVPHLTVVHHHDARVRAEAEHALAAGLPLEALAREAALWVRDDAGQWRERAVFPLGHPDELD